MKALATTMVLLFVVLTMDTCNQSSHPATQPTSASTRRYHLKGNVVSVDKRASLLTVDSEAIPGFMDAMIMPYAVKPVTQLEVLSPGDAITGDVVVSDDTSWLENIVVTGHAAPARK
jgi:protein SCO1/2